jgi:hypothetical protein
MQYAYLRFNNVSKVHLTDVVSWKSMRMKTNAVLRVAILVCTVLTSVCSFGKYIKISPAKLLIRMHYVS